MTRFYFPTARCAEATDDTGFCVAHLTVHDREADRAEFTAALTGGDYTCPTCGWSRVRLEGESAAQTRAAHEATDIHREAIR